ncbi:hypothetical protein SRO_1070 [Streptomyces rochei]|nr:hypothetical protein SRO_1070 [Streptomyces rochei]
MSWSRIGPSAPTVSEYWSLSTGMPVLVVDTGSASFTMTGNSAPTAVAVTAGSGMCGRPVRGTYCRRAGRAHDVSKATLSLFGPFHYPGSASGRQSGHFARAA